MSYQILANKWRPNSFENIVDQKDIIFFLKNTILTKKLHHAYLLHGPQGTGKTTIARIFSKCINCIKGITCNPCGKCKICNEINDSLNLDVIEIDAASKTKIEDIRDIINASRYVATYSKYKIYIIDEVHMLSINSFNALLKTLEEPQKNIIYILITTNIKKIPQTIISRCITLNLKKISNNQMYKRLVTILNKEQLKYQKEIIQYLIDFSNGSLRQALNTLEKLLPKNINDIITQNKIQRTLGIISVANITYIIDKIQKKDYNMLFIFTKKLQKENLDYQKILTQMQIIIHKMLIYKFTNKNIIKNITDKFKNITTENLCNYYKIITQEKIYIDYAPNDNIAFDIILVKMINVSIN